MTKTSFCSGAVGKPAPILAKGGFLVSKDFYPHQHSWWLLYSLSLQSKSCSATRQGSFFPVSPFCCPADNRIANGPNHGETDWGAVLFLRRKRRRFLNCFFLTTPDLRQNQQQNGQQKQGNHGGNQQTCANPKPAENPATR